MSPTSTLSKKLQVYKFLKEREGKSYCAAEIAGELGMNKADVRVYLYRLRKHGKIQDAEIVGNVKFYTYRDSMVAVESGVLDEVKALLGFLNTFFKQHAPYLSNDPAIMRFVQENGERFAKIEEVLKG